MSDTDEWDRWEHRMFGRDPSTDDLLNRHLGRTGSRDAANLDPAAQLQVAMLRDFLDLLRSALDDEHVDPHIRRRVVERVIYGGVPQRAVVEQMIAERKRWAEQLSLGAIGRDGRLLP